MGLVFGHSINLEGWGSAVFKGLIAKTDGVGIPQGWQ
jgi:hypothetical protein